MSDATTVYDENYPSRRLLDVIGDKWKPIVVIILGKGMRRYGELRRCLPDVSKKMLTQTLRVLEGDGLLKRTVYAEVPPKVEYELTPLGKSFLEPVMTFEPAARIRCVGSEPRRVTNRVAVVAEAKRSLTGLTARQISEARRIQG